MLLRLCRCNNAGISWTRLSILKLLVRFRRIFTFFTFWSCGWMHVLVLCWFADWSSALGSRLDTPDNWSNLQIVTNRPSLLVSLRSIKPSFFSKILRSAPKLAALPTVSSAARVGG